MAVSFSQGFSASRPDRTPLVGMLLMAFVVTVVLFFFLLDGSLLGDYAYPFLLPWLLLLAVVLLTPTAVLFYQGKLRLDNPIIFATWSYFFPAFVIGGIALAAGWSRPYFLTFIQDAEYNLPFTIVLIILGFAGLSIGYFLPVGKKIGIWFAGWLPTMDYKPSSYTIPGLLLLGLGILNSILALVLGIIGFQKADEINSYDGLIFLTTLFWMQASFLLWYLVFRKKHVNATSVIVIVLLVVTAVSKALFAGNRGSLIQSFTIIVLAYVMSGREFKLKQTALTGILLVVFLVLGMIYGTTFRNVKGSESAQSIDLYTSNIFSTFDEVGRYDNSHLLEFAFASMAERLDALSSMAVVVSTYEQLQPYEQSYGLDNNIWKDTTTFFIPRVVWPDKPVASEPRRYSDLYFNFGESSFVITPMGDLLRNFGVIGVPLGMLLLGIILRAIYRTFIEDQPRILWRATLYFMLLTAVSYESFFGSIIPYLFKIGITAVVGIVMVNLLARQFDRRQTRA
jgi:oligosaccharide repeat unit polymerase